MALPGNREMRPLLKKRVRQTLSWWRQHLPLIILLTRQELVDRHKGSVLGRIWTLLSPLINILVFVLIFSAIMGARLEGFGAEVERFTYSIYLISGILAWTAFAKSLSTITNLFIERAGMITKVNTSLAALPLSVLLAEIVVYLISMGFFAVFLLMIGFPIDWHWLAIPVVLTLQLGFTYALGFSLAILAVYLKDIREGVAVLLPVWFWLTPIVYVDDIIPDWALGLISLNPMFQFIDAYRELILYQRLPGATGLLAMLAVTLVLLYVGFWLLKRTERDLRDSL
ncbi:MULTISPECIES: ABC transporter permease [Halomonadaceae]|jgi:lipopolysaccharide transport system permease protein|nr:MULTISPECIES: ABC transporter permease [Halomonas]MCD1586419.1 ABC transporter permease [Halomonas sp. IOP_14]MCE7516516.1 ABC transporter permease [Halomonas titanicae]NVE92395.1 ABC transporter permease [Halomonas titanicae]QKS22703.1 Teichoic acid translocation permease protein TagG [Halomonas titanicae]CAD5268325.1 Transport permease protein [Halomonas sp. 156]|tara:strand:+ start:1013 stop:1864 length:852 start_codon:yes stop_codon:yes gene_type:complete